MRIRKQNQIININGQEFEIKGAKSLSLVESLIYKNLSECYTKPSNIKQSIYNDWMYKLIQNYDTTVYRYGINSYNTNMFTLHCYLKINDTKYYLYITKTKNWAFVVYDDEEVY